MGPLEILNLFLVLLPELRATSSALFRHNSNVKWHAASTAERPLDEDSDPPLPPAHWGTTRQALHTGLIKSRTNQGGL